MNPFVAIENFPHAIRASAFEKAEVITLHENVVTVFFSTASKLEPVSTKTATPEIAQKLHRALLRAADGVFMPEDLAATLEAYKGRLDEFDPDDMDGGFELWELRRAIAKAEKKPFFRMSITAEDNGDLTLRSESSNAKMVFTRWLGPELPSLDRDRELETAMAFLEGMMTGEGSDADVK